jgi:hypothetical protein
MSGSDQNQPFVEASFDFLVATMRMQAEMNLGLLPIPGQDKPAPPNLMLARHFIDLLSMLVEKTKGNLTTEESRGLENSITELRFRFVMASDKVAGDPGGAGSGGSAESAAAGNE